MFTKNKKEKVSTVAAVTILSAAVFMALAAIAPVITPVQAQLLPPQTPDSYFGPIISGSHGDNPSKQHYLADAKGDACKQC
jgi:hypothetical protein